MIIFLLIVVFIYLFAIMPKISNTPDFTPFMARYYAHRGLHNNKNSNPENSMTAFKLAIENQYGIELDVQLSKDGIPVIFHDFDLKRACGIDKKVEDCTYDELKELYLFGSDEKIPHLKDVLNLVKGEVPLIIELKSDNMDTSICNITTSYLDDYNGIYCVESFNPIIVLWYRRNRPNIIRGQLSTRYISKGKSLKGKILDFMLENLLFNFMTKPDFIAYNHEHSNNLSLMLCKKLYNTITISYTIHSRKDLKRSFNKFDLFIFDSFTPKTKSINY